MDTCTWAKRSRWPGGEQGEKWERDKGGGRSGPVLRKAGGTAHEGDAPSSPPKPGLSPFTDKDASG